MDISATWARPLLRGTAGARVLGAICVACTLLGTSACGGTPSVPAVGADVLMVHVVGHSVVPQPPQPASDTQTDIYAHTVRDPAAIAAVQSALGALHVVKPNEVYNCPTDTLRYYSYELRFYRQGTLVKRATADATACAFWHEVAGDTQDTRCCPTDDFWHALNQATGVPLPAY